MSRFTLADFVAFCIGCGIFYYAAYQFIFG